MILLKANMGLKVIISINFLTSFQVSLFLILFAIPLLGANSSFENNGVRCPEKERLALLKFKADLIDDYGRLSTWGNGRDVEKDCCKWEGVHCDNRSNHVVALDLHGPGDDFSPAPPLRGKISPSLLELAHLSYLDLSFNDFNKSQIPEFIDSLEQLKHLNLSMSNFGGVIPHRLGNLSMLQVLDLSGNWLLGSNDSFLGFQSLEYLDLSNNNLEGSIPDALGNITRLSHLDLSKNYLVGSIPDALGSLMSLSYLDLSTNQLSGEYPRASKNLSGLRYLDLSGNKLNGRLSHLTTWLWDSTKLEYLDLSENVLCGSLPNMSRYPFMRELKLWGNQLNASVTEGNLRLPNLEVLDVSHNKFSGRVPDLSSCSSLRWLSLYDNMFNGTLTESIGYLSKLEYLHLGSNHLEGLIWEAHLLNLSKLRALDLSFNLNLTIRMTSSWNPSFQLSSLILGRCKLGPYFPTWIQNQKAVEVVDISSAKISDIIPYWFWDTIQICRHLNMSYNQIYGVLPDLSSKLNLLIMDLSSNELNGSLPLLPPNATNINLSGNNFSGTIINLCNFRNLNILDLSNNVLFGEIPQDCFRNLMRINYVNLANNNLSGEIPKYIDRQCVVYSLHLRNNNFMGEMSMSLKRCRNLNVLDLGENKFSGKIPSWLGESMPELRILSLKSNKLYGDLPSGLCQLAKLQVLDISMNDISGTIPKCVKNFTFLSSKLDYKPWDFKIFVKETGKWFYDGAYVMWKGMESEYVSGLRLLKTIDLSSNDLTGEIPLEVTGLVGLLALNLSRNNLVGYIPRDIGRLELLNSLDLSRNNLSGDIPPALSQLSHLGVLDLSFNNLSGRIPWDTHLQTFGASVYMENPGLCGPPLAYKPCPEDEMPKNPNIDEEHEDKLIMRGFYISMALGFIVAFWGVSGTLFLNKWCRITILKMVNSIKDWL
ncbi:Leucine-rich repeat protein [Handroanthus impetiginosus]|uniref:Leucine-rich repeat protein n=1 Tax=Handroanthus impetiginosus TaxID=429701 RepID=A0A2G9HR20_9LAMI|nr:Leucine-rich repeat protein [Handroanthus impetiginosus]